MHAIRARPAVLAGALAAAAALSAAGCGSSDEPATTTTAASRAAAAPMAMGGMSELATATRDDLRVGLEAMAPETFFVSEGARLRRQSPGRDAARHMMVTLSDRASGIRLPDATVTLRLTAPSGRTAFDGPLYPMIGRGMGMHYGENVPLPERGAYRAQLVVGPPRIGRHMDSQTAWTEPVRVDAGFTWDGTRAAPAAP